MQDEQIKQKIASFPRWHYRFDLKGNPTPVSSEGIVIRHQQRKKYFFDPLVQLFDGSLAGKRVLDLGCNAGFWSLNAIRAGCDYVLGIDGRQMHVDQANFVFEVEEIERDKYDFIQSDLFGIDFREFGRFDVVLCLGLMYHISKHVELMEKISEVNDDVLLIDTTISTIPGSSFEVRHEPLDDPRMAVDHELIMIPTWEAVHDLVQQFGYAVAPLKPHFDDYVDARGFRDGYRRAFLCAKETDVSRVSAEIEIARPNKPRSRSGQEQANAAEDHEQDHREALRRLKEARNLTRAATEALRNRQKGDQAEGAADPEVVRVIERSIRELRQALRSL